MNRRHWLLNVILNSAGHAIRDMWCINIEFAKDGTLHVRSTAIEAMLYFLLLLIKSHIVTYYFQSSFEHLLNQSTSLKWLKKILLHSCIHLVTFILCTVRLLWLISLFYFTEITFIRNILKYICFYIKYQTFKTAVHINDIIASGRTINEWMNKCVNEALYSRRGRH